MHTSLAVLVGCSCLVLWFDGNDLMLVLAMAAVAVALLRIRVGLRPTYWLGITYILLSHLTWYRNAILVGCITLGYALMARKINPSITRRQVCIIHWILDAMSLLLFLLLFANRTGTLNNYVTVSWGLSSTGIFLLGLGAGSKPLRVTGLSGLSICIPHMFLVDLGSPLYRIVAFGVLGIVFLAVAFLYNRYKHIVQQLGSETSGD
jgi:hypothetical protein